MAAEGPKVLQSKGPRVQSSVHKYIEARTMTYLVALFRVSWILNCKLIHAIYPD
jgi:hypothetical protein